jgi:uncharacterized RDD family membrane protein YckC
MQNAAPSPSTAPKAGWWARFFALFLDNLILGIPAAILLIIIVAAAGKNGTGLVLIVYGLLIIAVVAYFVYFWTKDGQTLGNRALNIRVVKTDGSLLTVGGAIVRYIGYLLDSIIFGLPIGYIWAAFDTQKQAWHDKIAGTIVVKTT